MLSTTFEISSIIISFSSHNNLICVLFWPDIADRKLPVFLGIADAVLVVVPSMFIAVTSVDAASNCWFLRIHWSMSIGFYYSVVDCFNQITFPGTTNPQL